MKKRIMVSEDDPILELIWTKFFQDFYGFFPSRPSNRTTPKPTLKEGDGTKHILVL